VSGIGSAAQNRGYLTSFSSGRWRSCANFGVCDLCGGAVSGTIASHNAFNSESATRLSFIRSSRMATDTNCAVSRLPLSIKAVRHSSRVANTECNRCSELATSVFSGTELTR
jgi:hypothetical protein